MRRQLFAHDLAHEFLGYGLLREPEIRIPGVIDQRLLAPAGLFRPSLEALENRVVHVDGDARFPGRGNHRATLAFGEVIHLFHSISALWGQASAPRGFALRHPEEGEPQPSATRKCSFQCDEALFGFGGIIFDGKCERVIPGSAPASRYLRERHKDLD